MKNINEILSSQKSWKTEFKTIKKYFENRLGYQDCFYKKITVYFPDEGKDVKMLVADYYVNLMMLRPCIDLEIKRITIDMLFDCSNITTNEINDYLNNTYVRPYRDIVDIKVLNKVLVKVIENLKSVIEDYGDIVVVSYNLYEVIELAKKNEEFRDILYTKIPKDLQASEIEEYAKERLNRACVILENSDCGIGSLLRSGVFNKAQLQEFLVVIGNKPDIHQHTIDHPIDTNILVGGLNTASNMYVDAKAGRKALIMNKIYTGDSGYFSRKLNLLTLDLYLNKDPNYDCGTKNLVPIYVKDEKLLFTIEGKYYKFNPENNEEPLKVVNYNDYHLIDTTIYVRSAITCASKTGICKHCYGQLYNIVKDIHIGEFASTNMSARFTQRILSSKHSLMTNSNKILFDALHDYFILNGNKLYINTETNLNNVYVKIRMDDIIYNDDLEYNSLKEIIKYENIVLSSFVIVDRNGIEYEINEKAGSHLFPSDIMMTLMQKHVDDNTDETIIPISKIVKYIDNNDDDGAVFNIPIVNNELTKALNTVNKLFEGKRSDDSIKSINVLENHFIELLEKGKISQNVVHSEILLRNLVRDANHNDSLPDYSKELKPQDYEIFTLVQALLRHPSPFISLSYERVDEQLNKIQLYHKNKPSQLDIFFNPEPFIDETDDNNFYQENKNNDIDIIEYVDESDDDYISIDG